MDRIKLDYSKVLPFVGEQEIAVQREKATKALKGLEDGTCKGSDFLGWLDLPVRITDDELNRISACAGKLREQTDVVVIVGIGGSYLGAKAVIEAMSSSFDACSGMKVVFAGNNVSEDYLYELQAFLKDKKFGICVISKSGTTTEPAVAFRLLKDQLIEQEGLAVTIPRKGAEVAKMTEKDMEDVLQIREALDELAAKIACEQISEEQLEELVATMHEFEESTKTDNVKKIAEADVKFHDIIYQSTGNPKLVNMLNNLREQMYRYRVEYLKDENNYPTLMKEHKDIVEGLVRKNKTQVTETMHQHVKNQAVAVKAMIQEQE